MGTILHVFTPFADQLVAAGLTVIVAIIAWLLQPRVKLRSGVAHGYVHRISVPQQPTNTAANADGTPPAPGPSRPLLIHTASHQVSNFGRKTAKNVEVTFNFAPNGFEVWPQRTFRLTNNPNGRFIVTFDTMAPREHLSMNLLMLDADTPTLLSVRCDEAMGKQINLITQRLYPRWFLVLASLALLLGCATVVYAILQLIVLLVRLSGLT